VYEVVFRQCLEPCFFTVYEPGSIFSLQQTLKNVRGRSQPYFNQKQSVLFLLADDSNEVTQLFTIADFKVLMANPDLVQAIDTTF